MLRPEYLFIWILFHLAGVELPKSISKRGQPDLRATELVAKMQYQEAVSSYKSVKKIKSAPELRALAVAFTELGQNDTAKALYLRLFQRYPQQSNPTDQLNLALLDRRLGNYAMVDSVVTALKMQSFAGYPILNQPGNLFLEESKSLSAKLPKAKPLKFQNSSAHYLPMKDPVSQEWFFHERKLVNSGLLSSIDLGDGLPFAKVMKAENWNDSIGVYGTLLKNQSLNRHMELSYIDSFGNKYITTNHRLVNDSDAYLLDIFRYFKDPKLGKYTLETLNDQLWQHNLSGFVMNASQTKGLYCSDMLGGVGRADIYICDIEWNEDHEPKIVNSYSLGEVVNTILSESDPYFINDDIIAFSTEGHVGFGGSDLYFYHIPTNHLVNAGPRINTKGNEYGARYIDGVLYWASDAYKNNPQVWSLPLSQEVINWFFNSFGDTADLAEPEVFIPEELPLAMDEKIANPWAVFGDVEIDEGLKFLLLPDSARLKIAREITDSASYLDFRFRTLFYPYDGLICDVKFEIELWIVIELLKQRPNWVIDISSYTDSRGSADFNKSLSKNRAEFLRDYFVFYGVNKNQVDVHGYGEAFPINQCVDGVVCSEEEHRRNRRTTLHLKKSKTQASR